jgi:AraC-like DNA-binding protein
MLYLTANYISFLGSHKLVLDAVAHNVLTLSVRQKKTIARESNKEGDVRRNIDKEFSSLNMELKKWVDNKMYCEYDKTRDQVVEELHTTKELLNLYFIHKVGVDFRTWRTNLRIEEAKRMLLENEDLSLNMIAEMSGFSDKSNFHRQFTKIVGCSPKQFRDSKGMQ